MALRNRSMNDEQGDEVSVGYSPRPHRSAVPFCAATFDPLALIYSGQPSPHAPHFRLPLPFYCRAICPISDRCLWFSSASLQHRIFVTLEITWQFSCLQCRDGYGRAGFKKPFHRKRKASIALSLQSVVGAVVLFQQIELPTPRPRQRNGRARRGMDNST